MPPVCGPRATDRVCGLAVLMWRSRLDAHSCLCVWCVGRPKRRAAALCDLCAPRSCETTTEPKNERGGRFIQSLSFGALRMSPLDCLPCFQAPPPDLPEGWAADSKVAKQLIGGPRARCFFEWQACTPDMHFMGKLCHAAHQ